MIEYVIVDAIDAQVPGPKIIAHACNDVGDWGRGFVLSTSQRYPAAELVYRNWRQQQGNTEPTREGPPFKLGEMQLVQVTPDTFVANMIGQHGIMSKGGVQGLQRDGTCA